MSPDTVSRRQLLETGLLGGALALLSTPSLSARPTEPPAPLAPLRRRPKNVIFLVSDGMSIGVPSLAEFFSRRVRTGGTIWYELLADPTATHGHFETHSLDSLVTDSAAASSAWGSGSRVANGALNTLPDGTRLTPLAPLLHDAGHRVGLVTTTTMTHATPAGFAVAVPTRSDEPAIAAQYLGVVDVLLGGGREHFDPARRKDQRDLLGEYHAAGYTCCQSRTELLATGAPQRLLGLFGEGHLPYTIDHRNEADLTERIPTLAEMTRIALTSLAATDRGFLLQVEGGRVDHAAHANDAAALFWDQLAFDDAVRVAIDFAHQREDTLVVVTSDHGNSNPGLNGMGDSTGAFARLAQARVSYDRLRDLVRQAEHADRVDAVHEVFKTQLGITVDGDEARVLADAYGGQLPLLLHRQHRNLVGVLGQVLGNYTGIGWTGTSHTADLVLLTATGPGAELFTGLQRNTAAFRHLATNFDLKHENPTMSPTVAVRPAARQAAPTVDAHWV